MVGPRSRFAEATDYLDVAALLEHGIPLEDILGSARALFGRPSIR
jgi:hypothetical protein